MVPTVVNFGKPLKCSFFFCFSWILPIAYGHDQKRIISHIIFLSVRYYTYQWCTATRVIVCQKRAITYHN